MLKLILCKKFQSFYDKKIYSAIDFCNNLENDNDEEDEL